MPVSRGPLSRLLSLLLDRWPGQRRFGHYAFLPLFFLGGAAVELLMNTWTVGSDINFYLVYKRKRVEALARDAADRELLRRSLMSSPASSSSSS